MFLCEELLAFRPNGLKGVCRMPIGKTLSHVLRNGEETHENHKDVTLRTRYYRKSKKDVMTAIEYLIKNKLRGWQLVHVEDEHGEILATKRHAVGTSDVVVTVFSMTPLRSAVDVAVSRRGRMGDLGTSYNAILEFFTALNREVPPEK